MGGFSGSEGGQFLGKFMELFPGIQQKLGQFGQQGPSQQAQPQATMPQQGGGQGYPGFQMPPYTWHRSMPQPFNLSGNTGFQSPGSGQSSYGGMLNLPGWQMQQAAGQGGAPTTGWKPTTTQTLANAQNQPAAQAPLDPWEQLAQNGYAYIPGQGMAYRDPRWMDYAVGSGEAAGVSGNPGNGPAGTDGGIY
jgi:hypothetical protein